MIADWLRQFNMSRTSSITGRDRAHRPFRAMLPAEPEAQRECKLASKVRNATRGFASPSPAL